MKTITRTVRAENLPAEFRGDLSGETVVRVSIKPLTDENGLTPEQAADLRKAVHEADTNPNLPRYPNMNAYLDHLRTIK